MQSIKSNALEPTRSELAGPVALASRSARSAAGLRPADPDGPADHLLLAAPAANLPDLSELPLDPRRQGDHRDAVAGRDDADDGRPHRPDRRLRHRHVAHPRDRPAGHVRRAVAARDPDRARLRGAASACSTACSSRWRRSTPSSPRSAPARSSTRSRSGSPTGARSSALCRRASSRSTRHGLRHSDPGALRARARGRPLDRQRAAADRPLRLRHRRQREGRRAQRHPGARLRHLRVRRLGR